MGEIAGLYYEEHGPADGAPVILSPGLGGAGSYWAPNLDALAAYQRVILYDHRGTGRSEPTLQPNLTVDHMADDLLALMDGLSIASATLVGHAAGAVIGLAVALRAPERLDRLVAINGWSAPDANFARCMEARLALLHGSGVRAFVRAQPIFLYPARWISENNDRLDAEEEGHIAHFQGAEIIEARIGALAEFDVEERIGRVRTPTLLIVAEDDMLVPASCSERLARSLPNATLRPMLGGHACNVTEPVIFDKILRDWLAGALLQGAA
jgi:aminoacrylate hydrolase